LPTASRQRRATDATVQPDRSTDRHRPPTSPTERRESAPPRRQPDSLEPAPFDPTALSLTPTPFASGFEALTFLTHAGDGSDGSTSSSSAA
jgi:hypothetical protein